MKNTVKLEQKHINDLIKQDSANANRIDTFYLQSMRVISKHLNDFYSQYAIDDNLSIDDVQKSINSWDFNNYKQAINTLLQNFEPDDYLSSQLALLHVKAMKSKKSMLNSIIGAGIVVSSSKVKSFATNELLRQYISEHNYRTPKKVNHASLKAQQNTKEFNQKLDIRTSITIQRSQSTLDQTLQRGLDSKSLARLTDVRSTDDTRIASNISSAANNVISQIETGFTITAIFNTNEGKNDSYDINDYCKWFTERDKRVCADCNALDGQIFVFGQQPVPQVDTHFRCRCGTAKCDQYGNLKEVYPL